jgi:2-dehydro-3-deoxyphosphooctonate aldolase (KDO 8-P synthase)
MAVVHLKRWNLSIGGGQPLVVIAGINVLENLDLALRWARAQGGHRELGLPYVFKASFDKANRSSITSYRGPGLEKGLAMLAEVKRRAGRADRHRHPRDRPGRAGRRRRRPGADPAFLCRQTDLIVAAARATRRPAAAARQEGPVPGALGLQEHRRQDPRGGARTSTIVLCERGVSFGYNNLVVDMLGIGRCRPWACR